MLIGGFQKFSLIDFPKNIAALIFTQGCPFLCHYCHNPSLVLKDKFTKPINESDIFAFLEKRLDQLDGVVITGGEPTLQKDLIDFIKKVKTLNYKVKLDTNGTSPSTLKKLIDQKLIDYIAMDIKAPIDCYKKVIQKNIDPKSIYESIQIILKSKIDYEFRSTILDDLHTIEDIEKMAKEIKGAKLYFLQKFIPNNTLNPLFEKYINFSDETLNRMQKISNRYVQKCIIR